MENPLRGSNSYFSSGNLAKFCQKLKYWVGYVFFFSIYGFSSDSNF
jgi:hypothetical protein